MRVPSGCIRGTFGIPQLARNKEMATERPAATPEEAAYVFLEQAKQELARDKKISPLAVLVYAQAQKQTYDLISMVFTEETKRSAFQQVVSMAKQKCANAIIIVAPASYGTTNDGSGWKTCIFVSVSGHGIETVTLQLPYSTSGWLKKLRFGNLERKVQQAPPVFLAGWPS